MPDYDLFAVVAAYSEGLMSRAEAREIIGFHEPDAEDDDAVSFADRVVELEIETARLRETVKAQDQTINGFPARLLDEYIKGFDAGLQQAAKYPKTYKKPAPEVKPKPSWVAGGAPRPGRTFTVGFDAGDTTVQTPP